MKASLSCSLLLTAIGFTGAGCHTAKSAALPANTPVAVTLSATGSPAPAEPDAVTLPPPAGAQPIYIPGRVKKIYLEGGVDPDGNAFGPQEMWVKEDGHWNMDAVRHPSKAYIPPALAGDLPAPAAVVTANPVSDPQAAPVKTLRDLYKISDIIVTGFVERGQEPLALEQAAKAGDKYVAYFDDNLGWILLPKSALQPVNPG
ncbi:MAG: hypothetical protein PHE83_18420 [Opitutaceae bacterium]|nr:hypothetical protein [Opitutaceae bacterium]